MKKEEQYDVTKYVHCTLHELKIKTNYMHDIIYKGKNFEIRKDDRNYQVGDLIHFTPIDCEESNTYFYCDTGVYTITYILRNVPEYGLQEGYCILGIKLIRG